MSFNNITNIRLDSSLEQIEQLVLMGNPIERFFVSNNNRYRTSVKHLYLSHCKIRDIDESNFDRLYYLETLDLSYNFIEDESVKFIEDYPESSSNYDQGRMSFGY